MHAVLERVDELLPRPVRSTPYAGFQVVHDPSTSLIARVRETGSYEPVTVDAIVAALRRSSSPRFVDVGANVGLVTLGVLAALPTTHVIAFEPGPHQHDLLNETIHRNGLTDRVELHRLALADRPGQAEFVVHSRRHAAGDGLRDTGRSGRARTVAVDVGTLDGWWEAAGRPVVDALKLDVEGAELLALRGGEALLRSVRPTLFLEIDPRNIAPYPYDVRDVFAFLAELGYSVTEVEETEYMAVPDDVRV